MAKLLFDKPRIQTICPLFTAVQPLCIFCMSAQVESLKQGSSLISLGFSSRKRWFGRWTGSRQRHVKSRKLNWWLSGERRESRPLSHCPTEEVIDCKIQHPCKGSPERQKSGEANPPCFLSADRAKRDLLFIYLLTNWLNHPDNKPDLHARNKIAQPLYFPLMQYNGIGSGSL